MDVAMFSVTVRRTSVMWGAFFGRMKYPLPGLVNVYVTMERSTMLLTGKSTISMAIFNSFLYVYQRVNAING